MRKSCLNIIFGMLLLGLATTAANAQNARGTVLGNILDSSGAAVSGATVTLRNVDTNATQTFVTPSSGDYVFPNLIPDTYEVRIEAAGFKAATAAGLVVQVDHTLRQDFKLEVGAITQNVSVSATAQMLQTDNATIGQVMNDQFIENLPLNGRDFTSLIQLNAGVTQPSAGIQNSSLNIHGLNDFVEFSVNGARASSNSYLIDGIVDNDFLWGTVTASPPIDAIQEFKLQNGLYSAAYGGGSGQINVAIKSGTNQYHGTAYDYIRNNAFQPENKINAALNTLDGTDLALRTKLVQNQFGATGGGPIRVPWLYNGKDRSFFFIAYEGGRRVTQSAAQSYQVPTTQEKQGNFSDWPYPIYNPATSGSVPATPTNPAGRSPYANNTIPSSSFNSIGANLVKYFPTANVTCQMPCPDFVGTTASSIVTNKVTARVDQVLTSHDQLSGTIIWANDTEPTPSLIPATGTETFDRDLLGGLEWSHTFSPNTLNVFRFGGNRRFFHEGADTSFGPNLASEAGFQNATVPAAYTGIPVLKIDSGYSGAGASNNGYTQPADVFQFVDNLMLTRGKHNFTLGADIRRERLTDEFGASVNGTITFTGSYTSSNPAVARLGQAGPTAGNGFADLLLGDPLTISGPSPLGSTFAIVRKTDWNVFFQDDYHVSARLTLNLGIRYEIPGEWHSTDDSGKVFNPATPGGGRLFASRAFVESAVANPIYFQCCAPSTLVPNDYSDVAPRIGLAWRPAVGNNKLVLRGGFGRFYDTSMEYYGLGGAYSTNLFQSVSATVYPQPSGSEAISPLNLNTLWLPTKLTQPGASLPPAYSSTVGGFYWKNKTPWNQQWTFDTQYAITPDLMLDVAYIGLHGSREPAAWWYNTATLPTVAGDPCNYLLDQSLATGSNAYCLSDPNFQPVHVRVPYANFSAGDTVYANIGWSNYNALQVRFEKRFSQGLQFFANYTWSKNLDVVSRACS